MSTPYKMYEYSNNYGHCCVGTIWLSRKPPAALLINGDGISQFELNSTLISPYISRDGAPAIIWDCGTVHYFKNGEKHNEDGPASIYRNTPSAPPDPSEYTWALDGIIYTEQEWKEEMFKRCFK